jgi:RNA polymerase primary sigma factor
VTGEARRVSVVETPGALPALDRYDETSLGEIRTLSSTATVTDLGVLDDDPARPAYVDELDETAAATDLMRVYLNDIGRTPLLTAAEEVDMAKRIEAGVYAAELLRRAAAEGPALPKRRREDLEVLAHDGQVAKQHMLRANLRLVVSIAKKYGNRGVPLLDIVQDGNVGLVRAVEKFDYLKGFKFSTYATWWIRQAISKGVAEQSRTVRLPLGVSDEVNKAARTERDLATKLGRAPTDEEIAEAVGVDAARILELRRIGRRPASLDAPVGDGDAVLGDLLDAAAPSAADILEREAMLGELNRLIDQLPEQEAVVVRMRFGLYDGRQRTLDDVGRHLGLTREQTRRLERQALATLRQPHNAAPLLAWAG